MGSSDNGPVSDPASLISAPLKELQPLGLEVVTDTEGRQLWNAFFDRHHYLGYRRPYGAHIRYFRSIPTKTL